MNSKNESVQIQALKEGNQKLGIAFDIQIQRQDNLFQLQKNNYALMEECDKRNRKYRQIEEEVDTRDKIIKQTITNFRTQVGLRLLDIQKDNQKFTQSLNDLNQELNKINIQIRKNQNWISDQKQTIQNLQNVEISAIQYHESLTRKNNSLNEDLKMKSDDIRYRSEITWYSNEIQFLNKRISQQNSNQENSKSFQMKFEEEIRNLREQYKNKKKMIKSIEIDDFDLAKQKISHYQKKLLKLNEMIRDMHEIQKTLVSRISNLTANCIKKDIQIEKCTKMISQSKLDNNHSILYDDNNEIIYHQIKTKYQSKINEIDKSILDQTTTLQNQLQNIINAKSNHQKHIQSMKLEILELPQKEKKLNNELLKCDEISKQLDEQYNKLNSDIGEINSCIQQLPETPKTSDVEVKLIPQINLKYRNFDYDFQKIKTESALEIKINKTNEEINSLKSQINNYEINNKLLKHKLHKSLKNLKGYQNKTEQMWFYTHKTNLQYDQPTPIDSLKYKIVKLEKKINNRVKRNSKTNKRIKYKLGIIKNVEDCIKENELVTKPISFDNNYINEINIWILRIEREILKWKTLQHQDSISFFLKQWSEILERP